MSGQARDKATRDALLRLVIAMDGPAGSGKSSASRGVAEALGLRYLDTGAMYRALTWRMLLDGVDVTDPAAVSSRAPSAVIEPSTDPRAPRIRLDGVDVSRQIRTDGVTAAVSAVSAVPAVRELLRGQQRELIGYGGIVVEGRDIGTVVAPDASLKVYLSADPAARAQRRSSQLQESELRDVEAVRADLLRRDTHDSSRSASPLSRAPDALLLDTTDLSLDQVVDTVVGWALDRVAVRDGV